MNRLTEKLDDGTAYVCSETGNEGVGYFTTQRRLPELISKLAAYEDAEEQGRLVLLPCNPVWFVADNNTEYALVMSKCVYDLNVLDAMQIDKNGRYWSSREKAEAVLRKDKV